jgi:hypothetical protein
MKASKELLKKLNISENDAIFLDLKEMLKNNVGYMFMFTYFAYVENIQMYALKELYNKLKENKNILGDLPKPAANYRSYADLSEDLSMVKKMSAVKQFIQVCPSNLKQKIRNAKSNYSPDFVNSCHKFVELPKFKQHLFTLTISRYRNFNQISNALTRFIDYVNVGSDIFSTIDLINKTRHAFIRVIDFEHNVVVARVKTKSAVVALGKGTGWCIADPNMPQYWGQYVSHELYTVQYVVFDFNYPIATRNHKIGITVQHGSITNAHMFGNNPIRESEFPSYFNLDWFVSDDDITHIENIVDNLITRPVKDVNTNDIKTIVRNKMTNVLIDNISNINKLNKLLSDTLNSIINEIDAEHYNSFIVNLHKKIGTTKLFVKYGETLHLLNIESMKKMLNDGFHIKYNAFLTNMLNRYFTGNSKIETHSIVTENGVQYRKTVILEPLYTIDLDIINLMISNNKDIVTSKHLLYANTINNLELFKVLLKNFNGTIRSYNSLNPEFKEIVDEFIASK